MGRVCGGREKCQVCLACEWARTYAELARKWAGGSESVGCLVSPELAMSMTRSYANLSRYAANEARLACCPAWDDAGMRHSMMLAAAAAEAKSVALFC